MRVIAHAFSESPEGIEDADEQTALRMGGKPAPDHLEGVDKELEEIVNPVKDALIEFGEYLFYVQKPEPQKEEEGLKPPPVETAHVLLDRRAETEEEDPQKAEIGIRPIRQNVEETAGLLGFAEGVGIYLRAGGVLLRCRGFPFGGSGADRGGHRNSSLK